MQRERVVDVTDFGRADEILAHHPHRMERAVQIFAPIFKKLVKLRIVRRQIHILPDESLQQCGVIRHVVDDLHRRQPVTLELQFH